MAQAKQTRRLTIKKRIRKKISGSKERPRLSVFRSNKQFYAQFVDDIEGKTILAVSSNSKDYKAGEKDSKIEQAGKLGKLAADKSKEAGITEVVFDRNGYLYHGRVKAFAEAARKAGLKF